MTPFDYDIGVIGAGAAGLTVASGAAQLGAKTALVEKEDLLGGDCLHFGCVPSKTLIRSANIYHQLSRTEEFGLPKISAGPVDFSKISRRIKSVIEQIQHHDSVDRFSGLGVDVLFGDARFVDEHTVDLGSKRITAEKWVIATGSSPALPEVQGLSDVGVLTNKEIFSLDELPGALIILGAGAIALEMAQAFNRLGTAVTVLQRSEQVLSKEDKDMADIVMSSLVDEGVVFHLGATLLSVSQDQDGKYVTIRTRNDQEIRIQGSHILVAFGRSANTDGLGLDKCGVTYSSNGIGVDRRLRTSMKHIYAAGDVTGGYQFTHAAGYEGGIVLTNAILRLPRKVDYTWMPWCTYTSPELASIGMNEKRAQQAGLEYRTHEELFADNDRAQAEGSIEGKIKILLSKKDRPLGVQITGHHSGELLSEWVAALNGKLRLSTIAGAIHPYPTLAEINKRAVGSLLSKKLFSDKVRKTLKILFQYRG